MAPPAEDLRESLTPPRAALAPQLRALACALAGSGALALSFACAQKPVYWTRGEDSVEEFRRESRRCNEKAQLQVFEEARSGGGDCSVGTAGAGCGQSRRRTPFPEQTEKNRQERRRAYLYGECLEARGWQKNYEERGYKGR
jgi:hypothetical protein